MLNRKNIILAVVMSVFSNIILADEVTTTSSSVTKTTSAPSTTGASENATSTTVTTSKTVTNDNDSKIMGEIHNKFVKSTTLADTELTVTSDNGVVTISGTVTTQSQADEAVKIAKANSGVENVISQITVETKTNPK